MMKRWAIFTVLLYVLVLALLTAPLLMIYGIETTGAASILQPVG